MREFNIIVDGVKRRLNEPNINDNGEKLVDFCAQNKLRISNTYFDHKDQHNVTWSNTRDQTSMIDYIISNRAVHPTQVVDIRVLISADVGSDHRLILGRIRLTAQLRKKSPPVIVEKLNIESIKDETIKALYERRINQKIRENNIADEDNVGTGWNKIKFNMTKAAEEALGRRKVNKNDNTQHKSWFTTEAK